MKWLFNNIVLALLSIHMNLDSFAEWFEFKSVIYFFQVWWETRERLVCVSLQLVSVHAVEESFRDVSYIGKLVDVSLELLKFIIFIEDNIKVVFSGLISNKLINWFSLFIQLFKNIVNFLHIFEHHLLKFISGGSSAALLYIPGFFKVGK